jgi:hypothetical protein
MKEDTEKWLKKRNKDYLKRNTTDIKSWYHSEDGNVLMREC